MCPKKLPAPLSVSIRGRFIPGKKRLRIMRSLCGDATGNRTRVTAVKGRCLNRLTIAPYSYRAASRQRLDYVTTQTLSFQALFVYFAIYCTANYRIVCLLRMLRKKMIPPPLSGAGSCDQILIYDRSLLFRRERIPCVDINIHGILRI